ncbi:MAG: ATP-dependent DNA helicase RecQ [Parcubacteria group bacterium GW2011_GWD2_38_11]|nr:MAG: ATP-dependent DNA helicase RecQ [Parcubacteria group bacterium GW2011_GWD2_38_11]
MLEKELEKYFSFAQFRPGQKEVVEAIINGKDVVALMPTGGGKSLCFQLPAILSDKISIVISPLIALMQDQVDALNARGIAATYINSSLDQYEISDRFDDIKNGKTKIVYIAPERFGNREFQALFSKLDVYLLAVDEAHCVSQWGHDFRPDYLAVKEYIAMLPKRPIVAAFTATATPEVKDDIIERLALNQPAVFVRGFDRPNLKFFVRANLKKKERIEEALRIVKSIEGSGIIYAITRKETEEVVRFFKENGIKAAAYHAGMTGDKRSRIQNDFMENKFKVIVATIAFGMGVDKADIRYVIHIGMPSSPEGYYQEAGRAGRDGENAFCILLHSKSDASLHHFFIMTGKSEMSQQGKNWADAKVVTDIKYARLDKMKQYVNLDSCRRLLLLEYFGDPAVKNHSGNCKGCDVCLNYKWEKSDIAVDSARKKTKIKKSPGYLGGTILETANLYKQQYSPEKIAKIRCLGVSTIFNHLVEWYRSGGEFAIDDFLSKNEEEKISQAIKEIGSCEKLSPLKNILPPEISYEKIRMAIAKRQRKNHIT